MTARDCLVGLDGEGLGRDPHRYTLLAWSDGSGKRKAFIERSGGLSTKACLDFLTSMPEDVKPFGFYLQYDWTMMLHDLPNEDIFRLFRPSIRKLPKEDGGGFSYVCWQDFALHYLAGMMRIRKGQHQAITVWDVGRFYQCTFQQALKNWDVGSERERRRIDGMKLRRSSFSKNDRKQIREYCLTECRLLAQMVKKLNEAHEQAGLKLRSWHGPGSTAGVALKRWGIGKKRGELPIAVEHAVRCAFFGGRFEHSLQGIVEGPIYGRDIVSAYPAQCVDLPCLEHARWEKTQKEGKAIRAEHALVLYSLRDPARRKRSRRRWGPLPCRLRDGTILFPHSGATGWVWRTEYLAAQAWSQVQFKEAWLLQSDCGCQPFRDVARLFAERNRVGRKTGVGLTLKLAINSIYGKLAQSVGSPPFRSQAWAGMITSGTRAQLLGPIAKHDDAILGVATDGIYSREKIDVPCGDALGEWEPSEYEKITLVRPGIYWTESSVRARGIGRGNLSANQKTIELALERGDKGVELPPIDQFGGALSTVYMTSKGELRRSERFGQWFKRPVKITLDPRPKRTDNYDLWNLPGIESEPYRSHQVSVDAKKLKKLAELAWGNR